MHIAIYRFPHEETIHYIGPFETAELAYGALMELPYAENCDVWGAAPIVKTPKGVSRETNEPRASF